MTDEQPKVFPIHRYIYNLDKKLETRFTIGSKWIKWVTEFHFIWFRFYIIIEDRRPDMETYNDKYKSHIGLIIFNKTIFSFCGRTNNIPSVRIMNKLSI